mmetsp:Transcript_43774/g.81706  ORF Transcript_43774/g.81706 Transcript_43774/m.81706 type:complete len:99 (-) Transcript_43774:192-488(-)
MPGEQEILEVLAGEARAKIEKDMKERARIGCQEVESLVSAALRHLPKELRALPAREALWVFSKQDAGLQQACAALLGQAAEAEQDVSREGDGGACPVR